MSPRADPSSCLRATSRPLAPRLRPPPALRSTLCQEGLRRIAGQRDLGAVQSIDLAIDTCSSADRAGSAEALGHYLFGLRRLGLDGSRLRSLRDLGTGLGLLEVT